MPERTQRGGDREGKDSEAAVRARRDGLAGILGRNDAARAWQQKLCVLPNGSMADSFATQLNLCAATGHFGKADKTLSGTVALRLFDNAVRSARSTGPPVSVVVASPFRTAGKYGGTVAGAFRTWRSTSARICVGSDTLY
jgi:hypothetical protein